MKKRRITIKVYIKEKEQMKDVGTAALAFIGIIVLVGLLIGFPLMWLWNWLMVGLFGLPVIGFWQAVGLYLLSNILFKSSTSNSNKK